MTQDLIQRDENVSTAAVIALVLAMASVLGCGVTSVLSAVVGPRFALIVLGLPILGIGAVIFAVIALRRIGRSEGRLSGRPSALVGLFGGLMATVIQLAFVFGAAATISAIRSQLVPDTDAFFRALSSDPASARIHLSDEANDALPDAYLAAFADALTAEAGPYRETSVSFETLTEARTLMAERAGTGSTGSAPATEDQPLPVEARFHTDKALVYAFLDQDKLTKDSVRYHDMLIILPDGRALSLRPDGTAASLSDYLGLQAIPVEAAGSDAEQ